MRPLSLVHKRRFSLLQEPLAPDHSPRFIATPAVLEQIQREVAYAAESGSHLRVAGRGHTRAPLCRCDDGLLQLSRFTGIEDIDAVHGIVWARSGTRLATLARQLAGYGLALPTIGWAGNETVGGAVSIGSYGIGIGDSSHPSPVVGLRMVGADAATYSIGANDERLPLARISLGTLGVLSHVGLRCVPATHVKSKLMPSTLDAALQRSEALRAHDYADWFWSPHDDEVRLRFVDRQSPRRSARSALEALPTPPGWLQEAATMARRAIRQRRYRLLSRLLPQSVRDRQQVDSASQWTLFDNDGMAHISFALSLGDLAEALDRLGSLLRAVDPRHRALIRVRYVCADDAALSPAYGRETAVVDMMMRPRKGHEAHMEAASEVLSRCGARPMWSMPHEHHVQELADMYPLWSQFLLLRAQLDPDGLFLNDYLVGLFGVTNPQPA